MVEKEKDKTKLDGEAELGGKPGKIFNVCAKSPRVKTMKMKTIQTANVWKIENNWSWHLDVITRHRTQGTQCWESGGREKKV